MVLKHNLSIFYNSNDPFTGAIIESNQASNGFLIYTLLFVIYIIASYVILRRTNDIAKSLLYSLHIIMTLSLILFYMGGLAGYVLIPEILMLFLLVAEALAIGGMYFNRKNTQ